MGVNSRIVISWSDLPRELLEMISKFLETETDVHRFRAVCNSWRSSTTPLKKLPSTPLRLPFPFFADEKPKRYHQGAYFNLTERTVYSIGLPESEEPSFWLVKTELLRDGKMRILNPVSNHQIKTVPEIQMPRVLNTLDFRVSEVCKAYALQYVNPSRPEKNDEYKYAKKVIVSASIKNDEYVVMAIDRRDNLWYIKSGDHKWSMVPDNGGSNYYLDVVNYKGKFYGIDTRGGTWIFDSIFEATKIANDIRYRASKRHLVELYDGELHLIEQVMRKDIGACTCHMIDGCQCRFNGLSRMLVREAAVEIKICTLNKQEREWVEAELLNDRIVFAGDDCSFSFSTKEFEGYNGNRVFYTNQCIFFHTDEKKKPFFYNYMDDCCNSCENIIKVDNFIPGGDVRLRFSGLHGHNTGVFDRETGKMGSLLRFPEYADIFWPPPSWLRHT